MVSAVVRVFAPIQSHVASVPPSRVSRFKPVILDYDRLIENGNLRECSYCLTQSQVEALISAGEIMSWVTRWYSPSNLLIDSDETDAFSSDIVRRLMSGCCGNDVLTRFSSDGIFQTSSDGGVTWIDAADSDPRNAIVERPDIPGTNTNEKKCARANSAVTYFKNFVQNIQTAKDTEATEADITAIFIGFLILLGIITAGWIFALLGGLIALLVTNISAEQWEAAFTEDVWQDFLCLLYCNMESDGSFTVEEWDVVRVGVLDSGWDQIAIDFIEGMVKTLYATGLTNVCRQELGGELLCDECCPTCNIDDWDVVTTHGTEVSRDDTSITVEAVNIGGAYFAIITTHLGFGVSDVFSSPCCVFSSVEWIDEPADHAFSVVECGESYNNISTGVVFGFNGWLVQIQSTNTPFTVRIILDAPPP